MEENNNKNLLLAVVLSMAVIMIWFVLFPPPEPPATPATTELTVPPEGTAPPAAETGAPDPTAATAVLETPRLSIDTPSVQGSISMLGGRIDDLQLKGYRETLDPGAENVRLLSPVGEEEPFYALFGWVPAGSLTFDDVPGPRTEWQIAEGATLSPQNPVTLRWDNGKGLIFTRKIAVDEEFMFTVTETVENTGTGDVSLAPYGLIARHGLPSDLQNIFVVHEGAIARADGELTETDYADITDLTVVPREGNPAEVVEAATDGWIGFTDHYWMAVLVPEAGKPHTQVTKYVASADIYQTEVRQPAVTVAAGTSASTTTRLFAGAKEWATIRAYQNGPEGETLFGKPAAEATPIGGFLDSIDWGWFYFLTKPIFAVLHWLNALIGNMGLAIIALTFVLKIIVLPLAYKSYVSMARMKELQPDMEALRERCGEDKQRMQREMLQLYKDKKVNPAAGCLPILIQIPIFFALYKVIFVTIELRHAPFFGWLTDLSAPTPRRSTTFSAFCPGTRPRPAACCI